MEKTNFTRELVRVGKHLNEVVVVKDAAGNLLHKFVKPIMLEFYPRDIMQLIVGATILAVPVSFTEEVWKLASFLPIFNVILIFLTSMFFIGIFIFHNYYRRHFKTHWIEFIKRTGGTYLVSLLVSIYILYLIGQYSFEPSIFSGLKTAILVALPASMSAAVADMIK